MLALFLKMVADVARSLTYLFSKSIETNTFPSDWKRGNVTPIHKGGTCAEGCNYRPITLLPIVSKTMERLLIVLIINCCYKNSTILELNTHL